MLSCLQVLAFREQCVTAVASEGSRGAAPSPAPDAAALEEGEMPDAAPKTWDVFAFPHLLLDPANAFRCAPRVLVVENASFVLR